MAEMAVADGIATIIATPHQLGNHAKNSGETIRAATAEFQRFLEQRHVPLQVLPGGDVRIEPDLLQKIRSGEVLTLGDRRRHVLLELPHDVYVPLGPAARRTGTLPAWSAFCPIPNAIADCSTSPACSAPWSSGAACCR